MKAESYAPSLEMGCKDTTLRWRFKSRWYVLYMWHKAFYCEGYASYPATKMPVYRRQANRRVRAFPNNAHYRVYYNAQKGIIMSYSIVRYQGEDEPVVIGNIQRHDAAEAFCLALSHLSDVHGAGYKYVICPTPRLAKGDGVDLLEKFFDGEAPLIKTLSKCNELKSNKILEKFLGRHNEEIM